MRPSNKGLRQVVRSAFVLLRRPGCTLPTETERFLSFSLRKIAFGPLLPASALHFPRVAPSLGLAPMEIGISWCSS